jgi:hypothetical protein
MIHWKLLKVKNLKNKLIKEFKILIYLLASYFMKLVKEILFILKNYLQIQLLIKIKCDFNVFFLHNNKLFKFNI